ncbi:MAG TPA: YfhO family protein, partial [Flavisolibacter sp.]|nr:YfhO family protein [Flavisolibacter sp.]
HQLSKGNMAVYNMLNTRYFIMQNPSTGKVEAQLNQSAFGPVWLVKGLKFVSTPDDEMGALDHTSLSDTAVVQQKFANQINIKPVNDSTASIHLIQYRNDTLRYAFNAAGNQFAVFSEIYYPLGWNAYIDGKKSDYVKTDYALRGMAIPAGRHEIEFRFEPGAYWLGDTLSVISGYIVLFLLILAVIMEIKRKEYILKSTVN